MSEVALVVAIALPVGLFLAGLVWFGRRQESDRDKLLKANRFKRSADELRDALDLLIVMDSYREIQHALLKRIEFLYARYREILPPKSAAKNDIFDPEPYSYRIDEGRGGRATYRSDRELHMAARHFTCIYKTLATMAKRREISEAQHNDYRRYLLLAQLDKEVNTYASEGDAAAERGDLVTATHYYKAAKKALIECKFQFPEKNDRIRDLTQRSADLYQENEEDLEEENLRNGLPISQVEKQTS